MSFSGSDVATGEKHLTYTVREIKGSDARITYDETVYTVVVTVVDDGEGGVSASYTVNGEADGEMIFTNVHTSGVPDTSDGARLGVLITLVLISGAIVSSTLYAKKRRVEE